MTLPQYGFDYKKCTLAELRKFYAERHDPVNIRGVKVHKLLTRTCVEALKTLDRTSTFRFLDLPAEVRVMVLPWLLTYDQSHHHDGLPRNPATNGRTFPAILRASKLCYREGKEVLLSHGTIIQEVRLMHPRQIQELLSTSTDSEDPRSMERKLFDAILRRSHPLTSTLKVKELRNITFILREFRPRLSQFKRVFDLLCSLFLQYSGEYWLRLVKIKIMCGCLVPGQTCTCSSVIDWKRWGRFEALYQEPPKTVFKRRRAEPEPEFSTVVKHILYALVPEGTRVVFECPDEKAAARLQGLLPETGTHFSIAP
jgi:hypothetical protein